VRAVKLIRGTLSLCAACRFSALEAEALAPGLAQNRSLETLVLRGTSALRSLGSRDTTGPLSHAEVLATRFLIMFLCGQLIRLARAAVPRLSARFDRCRLCEASI
jgi:hypothetical protein